MRSRQRGAAWLLALLLAGRLLDHFDLPFESHPGVRAPAGGALPLRAAPPDSAAPRELPPPAGRGADSTLPRPARAPLPAHSVAINRAGAAELQRLPGVGPVLAGRIIAQRDTHGPFRSPADLRAVRGIGPRTCARLAPLLRFD